MESKLKEAETKIIKKYGYEYHLVEVNRDGSYRLPQPCFMGFQNYALSKCVKIDKIEEE